MSVASIEGGGTSVAQEMASAILRQVESAPALTHSGDNEFHVHVQVFREEETSATLRPVKRIRSPVGGATVYRSHNVGLPHIDIRTIDFLNLHALSCHLLEPLFRAASGGDDATFRIVAEALDADPLADPIFSVCSSPVMRIHCGSAEVAEAPARLAEAIAGCYTVIDSVCVRVIGRHPRSAAVRVTGAAVG